MPKRETVREQMLRQGMPEQEINELETRITNGVAVIKAAEEIIFAPLRIDTPEGPIYPWPDSWWPGL